MVRESEYSGSVGWPSFELIRSYELVSVIIRDGQWYINARSVAQWFAPSVEDVQINEEVERALWAWRDTTNWAFDSREVYELLRPQFQQVAWADVEWAKGPAVKMKLCVYKAIYKIGSLLEIG